MDKLTRWPLLMAAIALIGTGVGLDVSDANAYTLASACVALGSASAGALLYAEGARHREWWDERHGHPDRSPTDPGG